MWDKNKPSTSQRNEPQTSSLTSSTNKDLNPWLSTLKIETYLLLLDFLPSYLNDYKETEIKLLPKDAPGSEWKYSEFAFNNLFWKPREKHMLEILRREFIFVFYPQYLFQQANEYLKFFEKQDISSVSSDLLLELRGSLKKNSPEKVQKFLDCIISINQKVILTEKKQAFKKEIISRNQDPELLGYIETRFVQDERNDQSIPSIFPAFVYGVNNWEEVFEDSSCISLFDQLWGAQKRLRQHNYVLKMLFYSWLEIKLAFVKWINNKLNNPSLESSSLKEKKVFFSFWKEKIYFNFKAHYLSSFPGLDFSKFYSFSSPDSNTEKGSFIETLSSFVILNKQLIFVSEIKKALELFLYSNPTSISTRNNWKEHCETYGFFPPQQVIKARNYIYLIDSYFFESGNKTDIVWFLNYSTNTLIKWAETVYEYNNSSTPQQKSAKRSELIVQFREFQKAIIKSEILIKIFLYRLSILRGLIVPNENVLAQLPYASHSQLLDEETYDLAFWTLGRNGCLDKEKNFTEKPFWKWISQQQEEDKLNIFSAKQLFFHLVSLSQARLEDFFYLGNDKEDHETENVFFQFVQEFEDALFLSKFTVGIKGYGLYSYCGSNELIEKLFRFLRNEVKTPSTSMETPSTSSNLSKQKLAVSFYRFFLKLSWLQLELKVLKKNFEKEDVMFFCFLGPKDEVTEERKQDLIKELLLGLETLINEKETELVEEFRKMEEIRISKLEQRIISKR